MLPGRKYRVEDVVHLLWRRKWLIAAPFGVLAAATAFITSRMPDQFRSDTLIMVVPQRVPETYVRSTVSGRIEDRLQTLQQQILSRTRLERIILDLDLYPERRRRQPLESVVQLVRAAVKVETVRGDAFTVSYVTDDPRTAQTVTERLASLFIEENLRDREVLADGTSEFLQTQLDDARRRLIEQEKKLEGYRLKYAGELPSQAPANLQAVQSARLQLQALADTIDRDRDRQASLERQITDLLAADTPATVPAGPSSGAQPAADGSPPRLLSAAERLDDARTKLAALELRLTPEHPDVVRQRRLVQQLTQQATSDAAHAGEGAARPRTPVEQARDRRVRDLRAELDAITRDMASREAQAQRVRDQMGVYQARLDAAPIRESEMTELTRDYDTLQQIYRGLLAKREDSKIAANLERRQVGEQFRVLDPARVPERPFSPDRTRLNLLGAFVGLLIGLGMSALLEYADATLKTEEDVRTVLALPVLATIPVLGLPSPERRGRWRTRWPLTAAAAAGAIAIVLVLAWSFR